MAAYPMTPLDLEAGLDERTVVVLEKSSPGRWPWKACVALLVVALCVAEALLYLNARADAKRVQSVRPEARQQDVDEARDPHQALKRIGSKAKAAIHLEGHYKDGASSGDQLEWTIDQGQAFAQGGFSLKDNQIVIPRNGLYFVYSQASFRVTCNDAEKDEATRVLPLSHRIWRLSDSIGSANSLMSAVRSACQRVAHDERVGEGWYNAIYLGAVFQLNKGDRLWTETNQRTAESEGGKTFFGGFSL